MMTMRLRNNLALLFALGLLMMPSLLSAQGADARDTTKRDMKAGAGSVPATKIGTVTRTATFESVGADAVGRGSFNNQAHVSSPMSIGSPGTLGTYTTLGATIGGAKD
ncbi:MAG: hypothetical protein ABI876_08330, partial [Bacteroidota bacterium]